jgi:ubiquinone/menaquinone biosynthesis C-methylase UbiE
LSIPVQRIATLLREAVEQRIALSAPARRLRLAHSDRILAQRCGDRAIRLLDAGCGDGLLSLALAKRHPAWTIVGLDVRDDLLSRGRLRATARGLHNVQFVRADLTEPLPQSGFDVALVIECLSEIRDDEGALRNVSGALAPGGLLVAQVPERSWRARLPGAPSTWREQVRQGYDSREFAALLRGVGLQPIEMSYTFRATAAVAQELRDKMIKDGSLAVRTGVFPLLAAAAWLEYHGATAGRANALLAVARRQ